MENLRWILLALGLIVILAVTVFTLVSKKQRRDRFVKQYSTVDWEQEAFGPNEHKKDHKPDWPNSKTIDPFLEPEQHSVEEDSWEDELPSIEDLNLARRQHAAEGYSLNSLDDHLSSEGAALHENELTHHSDVNEVETQANQTQISQAETLQPQKELDIEPPTISTAHLEGFKRNLDNLNLESLKIDSLKIDNKISSRSSKPIQPQNLQTQDVQSQDIRTQDIQKDSLTKDIQAKPPQSQAQQNPNIAITPQSVSNSQHTEKDLNNTLAAHQANAPVKDPQQESLKLESSDKDANNETGKIEADKAGTDKAGVAKTTNRSNADVIFALHVKAQDSIGFYGPELHEALEELGMKHGDMEIYHYASKGQRILSVMNMVKPGTFNVDDLKNFTTPGISIFLQLTPQSDLALSEQALIQSSKYLAHKLKGHLLNQDRSAFTEETEQKLIQSIRNAF